MNELKEDIRPVKFDTCGFSILHFLFAKKHSTSWGRSYIIPFFTTLTLFFIIPLLVAISTSTPLLADLTKSPAVKIGLFNDWASIFMYSITMPLFVVFMLRERTLIPDAMSKIINNNAISFGKTDISKILARWESIYKYSNVIAQTSATWIAIMVGWLNFTLCSQPEHFGWQGTNGHINVSGLIFSFWQMPLFFWIITVYVFRGATTVIFLYELAKKSVINVSPFYDDRANGMSPVGYLGLRNQYLFCACGTNIVFMGSVCFTLGRPGDIYAFYTAVIAYIIFAPLIFIAPLLPFHKVMSKAKKDHQQRMSSILQKEYNRAIETISDGKLNHGDFTLFEKYKILKKETDRIPVWPIDLHTVQKCVSAYILPILISIPSGSSFLKVITDISRFFFHGY